MLYADPRKLRSSIVVCRTGVYAYTSICVLESRGDSPKKLGNRRIIGRTAVLPNLTVIRHRVATVANTLPERTYISYIMFQLP